MGGGGGTGDGGGSGNGGGGDGGAAGQTSNAPLVVVITAPICRCPWLSVVWPMVPSVQLPSGTSAGSMIMGPGMEDSAHELQLASDQHCVSAIDELAVPQPLTHILKKLPPDCSTHEHPAEAIAFWETKVIGSGDMGVEHWVSVSWK